MIAKRIFDIVLVVLIAPVFIVVRNCIDSLDPAV